VVYTNVKKVEDDRICPVCAEEAPPGETHHPHYGGICCYSCRAFFRRANQKSKTPTLKCKKGIIITNIIIVSRFVYLSDYILSSMSKERF
jgi:Zinc finger, C4 type (two domains)